MYTYLPLDPHDIRLLIASPGLSGSDIHVSLSHARLDPDDPPHYEALSYAWGSNGLTHLIHVDTENGTQSLAVTENLHIALQHLRDESSLRTLWVDAACINQRDNEERSQQVTRMADIYQSAAIVIVWLGPAADDSTVAIEALEKLAARVHVEWYNQTISAANGESEDSHWLAIDNPVPFDDETWFSIDRLLDRPWFSRLWIFQEVRLACHGVTVLCGDDMISWEDFRKVISLLKQRPSPTLNLEKNVDQAWNVSHPTRLDSFIDVLDRTKHAQCSDQRDRIYGVLNLIPEEKRLGIQPDYNKTTREVFRDVMVESMKHGDFWLLSCCELQEQCPDFLPSWVPNWSVTRKCVGIWGATAASDSRPQISFNDNGRQITATGRRVGKILKLQQRPMNDLPSGAGTSRALWIRTVYAALRRLTSWLRNQLGSNEFDRQLGTIWRSLCCNEFSDRQEPINDNYMDFEGSLEYFRILSADPIVELTEEFLSPCLALFNTLHARGRNRSFVMTEQGHLGLAPKMARQSDYIVVLLGCTSPMVLRPKGDGQYLVVGEAYMHGLMTGEAFLGPLPEHWQYVFRSEETTGFAWGVFIDRRSNVCRLEDPRLGPLPDGWVEEEHPMQHCYARYRNTEDDRLTWNDPRLLPSELRARGVELEYFKLV
ncbi:MAG: hypothetical protein Q9168_007493 [Polycauliona sp. 1 TL-2023]